jgi:hypothetical protein
MEIMEVKDKTIVYESKDCGHDHLEKLAPLWYFCTDCGKIFMIPFTMQYSREQALEHLGGIVLSIRDKGSDIAKAQEKEIKREEELEKQAVKDFKEKPCVN